MRPDEGAACGVGGGAFSDLVVAAAGLDVSALSTGGAAGRLVVVGPFSSINGGTNGSLNREARFNADCTLDSGNFTVGTGADNTVNETDRAAWHYSYATFIQEILGEHARNPLLWQMGKAAFGARNAPEDQAR